MKRAIARLDDVLGEYEKLRPARPADVLETLRIVAATIQVELPQEEGLTAYVALLGHVPRHVITQAGMEILKKHAIRTMPLPAEFLNSEAMKSWTVVQEWFPTLVRFHRDHLQARLDTPA